MTTPNDMAQNMGIQRATPTGEMATAAMAAKSKATIEARYVIAYNRPRNIEQARIDILSACKRPGFAEAARYKKPVGGSQTVDGFSIRFAEEAIKAMKNIAVDSMTIFEDHDKRTVQIAVTDLESNLTYSKEVNVQKTVERRSLKQGQMAISQRTNSTGQIAYLVEATEDEIANKIASAESKVIRNCGLRLVPSDILEEAEVAIEETLTKGGGDVKAGIKKLTDAFAGVGVQPTEIEKYLGHALSTVSPKELADLRAIFSTVRDGQASWADYVTEKEQKKKPDLGSKPPGDDKKPEGEKRGPGRPKKELSPEEAAVANRTSVDAGSSEPATKAEQTPQESMGQFIHEAGVSFDDFRGFLISDGHFPAADSIATIDELPAEVCRKLAADAKAMSKLVKLFGNPNRDSVTP